MSDTRQIIPVAGLLATMAASGYMVARLSGQSPTANVTNATRAEVRDAQGQIVLSGQFQMVDEDDDDTERKAVLTATGVDTDATGEAEMEFSRETPSKQEVEFSVKNLSPRSALTFVIDGTEVAKATADSRGRAEVEIELPRRSD